MEHKKILVIEDNDLLIITIKAMLVNLKMNFLLATSGLEGVDLYKQNSQDISVVLCDMFLHDTTAKEVYEEIVKINPEVNVLLSSGAFYEEHIETLLKNKNIEFLQKPYTIDDLATALKKFKD